MSAYSADYSPELLQTTRPQPMYDKNIHRLYGRILRDNPGDNHNLIPEFKDAFLRWLDADQLNQVRGYREGFQMDVCIGCTHFIDDLYQSVGSERLMIFANDYKYHQRLNPELQFTSLGTLQAGKELLIAMPFPYYGDIHPQMDQILARCLELGIPVHADAAWLSCCKDIVFDFAHPAIESFAISLSKGMGTGGNRVGMRFTRKRKPGAITIMNDFNMNCQSLVHIGTRFMEELGANYFWRKYGDAYAQVCADFSLRPTKAIHLATGPQGPVGIRPLLRFLNDR